jgi:hypothetical protein
MWAIPNKEMFEKAEEYYLMAVECGDADAML